MRRLIVCVTLYIASLACMTSGVITETPVSPRRHGDAGTATTAGESDIVSTQTAIPDLEEPVAGAVFELPTPSSLCARVTASQSLHLRDQPNEQARVLAYLHNGEQVRVIEFGKWWKISTAKGEGFSNAKYLSLAECE